MERPHRIAAGSAFLACCCGMGVAASCWTNQGGAGALPAYLLSLAAALGLSLLRERSWDTGPSAVRVLGACFAAGFLACTVSEAGRRRGEVTSPSAAPRRGAGPRSRRGLLLAFVRREPEVRSCRRVILRCVLFGRPGGEGGGASRVELRRRMPPSYPWYPDKGEWILLRRAGKRRRACTSGSRRMRLAARLGPFPSFSRRLVRGISYAVLRAVENGCGDTWRIPAAMLTSNKALLARRELVLSRRLGFVHVFCHSGLHAGLAAWFLLITMGSLLGRRRKGRRCACLLLPLLLWCFCCFGGWRSSAVRASIQACIVFWAGRARLRGSPLVHLHLGSACTLLLEPSWFFSWGFWMSHHAAMAVTAAARGSVRRGIGSWAASLRMSCAAWSAVAPWVLYMRGGASLVAVPLGPVLVPALLATGALGCCCSLLWSAGMIRPASALASLLSMLEHGILRCCGMVSSMPLCWIEAPLFRSNAVLLGLLLAPMLLFVSAECSSCRRGDHNLYSSSHHAG